MTKVLLTCILLLSTVHLSKEKGLDLVEVLPEVKKEVVCKKQRTSELISDMDLLQPAFKGKAKKLIDSLRSVGIEVKVIETYRTYKRQDKLFNRKRRVTLLRGGQSAHQHGLAIDIVPIVSGKLQWKNKMLWKKIGTIGESLGLTWGGRFRRLYDPGHFELPDVCGTSRKELEELSIKWIDEETIL